MAAGGLQAGPSIDNPPIAPTNPMASFGNPATFTAAATKQASDYDTIMQNYSDYIANFARNPLTASPVAPNAITPQTSQYSASPDVTSSIGNLKDLSSTGGYSAGDIANIRERDISPIRSIYANAQQNIERAKSLSGGYSPSYNATTAQLTRDEANKVGDVTTAANAGIAQNVAGNRIAAASPYASASATENAAKTQSDQNNANIINQINALNEQNRLQAGEFNTSASLDAQRTNKTGVLGAIQGQTSLYGTTPALTNTFGNQVVQAGQLGQGQQQLNTQRQNSIFNAARPGG